MSTFTKTINTQNVLTGEAAESFCINGEYHASTDYLCYNDPISGLVLITAPTPEQVKVVIDTFQRVMLKRKSFTGHYPLTWVNGELQLSGSDSESVRKEINYAYGI